jgi:hypothetical protein
MKIQEITEPARLRIYKAESSELSKYICLVRMDSPSYKRSSYKKYVESNSYDQANFLTNML